VEAIRIAFKRCVNVLTLRPSHGRSTGVSRTRIRQGLVCEIEEGPWRLTADLPVQVGGSASAPTPGVYGRAAFGSCLAICYMMHAARLGVPITSLDIEVQSDYDNAGLFGVGTSPAGYSEVRYTVTVASPAPEHDIMRVLDEGDAHSPYLENFSRAIACRRSVRIVPSEAGDAGDAGHATQTTEASS
jgi:uncharacterized OsmC-like protein